MVSIPRRRAGGAKMCRNDLANVAATSHPTGITIDTPQRSLPARQLPAPGGGPVRAGWSSSGEFPSTGGDHATVSRGDGGGCGGTRRAGNDATVGRRVTDRAAPSRHAGDGTVPEGVCPLRQGVRIVLPALRLPGGRR